MRQLIKGLILVLFMTFLVIESKPSQVKTNETVNMTLEEYQNHDWSK